MGQSLVPYIRQYADLDKEVDSYRRGELSEFTISHYYYVWRLFIAFMGSKDVWKADSNDIARWMVSRVRKGVTPRTIYRDLGGINYYFEVLGKGANHGKPGKGTRISPTRDDLIRRVMRGMHRKHGRPMERKTPLLLDSLEKMLDQEPNDHVRGIRNKAILALAWGAALRVNETRMLDVTPEGNGMGWVEISDDGVLVHLRRSKANRYGKRKEIYAVPARTGAPKYCPVRLLRQWLKASGHASGPLFLPVGTSRVPRDGRLHRGTIRALVKRAARAIGLDVSHVGGQSLRAGCLTWLAMQQVNIYKIQDHSGHRDIRNLIDYIRKPKSAKDSALTGTRWTV
ncbi:MAG: tyrosine-type recombinase/integrase [Burkholderiales bacterium]